MVSVVATQHGCCGRRAASDKKELNGCGCVPIKLDLGKQVTSQIWPKGHSLPTSSTEEKIIDIVIRELRV